jgi:hypothetical protein
MLRVEFEEGTHPSSINCRPERREGSPNIGKGQKTPSQPTRSVVLSEAKDLRRFPKTTFLLCHAERSEESPIQSKGETDPFRTYPIKDLKPFGGALSNIIASSIN